MCCGNSFLSLDQPVVPPQQGIFVPPVVQPNTVTMNDSVNSQRAAEVKQANTHAQNFGQNG